MAVGRDGDRGVLIRLLIWVRLPGQLHHEDGKMRKIQGFRGEYRFLSNFWASEVKYDFVKYPTVEHAYQASKTMDLGERRLIGAQETPGNAKRLGKNITLREDWDDFKIKIMFNLLLQKFQHEQLKHELLETRGTYIEETNVWGDTFWGVCDDKGSNILGIMLMRIRDHRLS